MGDIQALRGTRDILPDEIPYWHRVEDTAREILGRATYSEIRPPIFESTALFARGLGEATDVVGKEMYTFTDRGDRSVTLRPEGTAGVARAYIEHGLHTQGIQRLWYVGPMFRYERPQAGRQRQFHQIGLELLGSDTPRADVEAIAIATDILQALGLQNLKLNLNSLGDRADRQHYRERLVAYLSPFKAELDADSQDRLERNPLRILDSKDARTQEIVAEAPKLADCFSDATRDRFAAVRDRLSGLGIDYIVNPLLVRGLDYYTHTAFEIQSADLGSQATVCGGGRYDGLVSQLGGPETGAIGWAMGMERLILLLKELQSAPVRPVDFYVVSRGSLAEAQALRLSRDLRQQQFTVELDLSGSAFGKQFKRADRSGAVACLIIGDTEAEHGTVNLKWLATQEQTQHAQADLLRDPGELRRQIKALRS